MRKLAVLIAVLAAAVAQAGQPPPIPTPSPTASSAVSLTSITIAPLSPTIKQDDTVQLTATAHFSDGAVQQDFPVSWASSDPNVAQIVNAESPLIPKAQRGMARAAGVGPPGTVLGMAGGVATITARANTFVASTQVTVQTGPMPTPTETPTQLPSATPSPTTVPPK